MSVYTIFLTVGICRCSTTTTLTDTPTLSDVSTLTQMLLPLPTLCKFTEESSIAYIIYCLAYIILWFGATAAVAYLYFKSMERKFYKTQEHQQRQQNLTETV